MDMEFDLFSFAINELSDGQFVTVTGKDTLGGVHTKETVIVRSVSDKQFLTTNGLTFKSTDLTRITISQEFVALNDLPFVNLTGEMQNFDPEPE